MTVGITPGHGHGRLMLHHGAPAPFLLYLGFLPFLTNYMQELLILYILKSKKIPYKDTWNLWECSKLVPSPEDHVHFGSVNNHKYLRIVLVMMKMMIMVTEQGHVLAA